MLTAVICAVMIIALVLADQLIKFAVVSNMRPGESIAFIDGVLQWTYVTNEGASWGILGGQTVLLVIVTLVLIAGLTWYLASGKLNGWVGKLSYVLILSGGIGNMIDRVFNDGKVVDYIDVSPLLDFPVFNLADCCVVCGGILLCIFVIFMQKEEGKSTDEKAKENDEV